MKKLLIALIMLTSLGISCNKNEVSPTLTLQKKTIKKTRATKCDRDYIIHPGTNGSPSTYRCPKPGNLCYRDKKGNHGCGEYADPMSKLATYTNQSGSINSIEYVNNEDFTILFPDINQSLYDQIVDGELNLYSVAWADETAIYDETEETCTCQLSTYVLSSASNIDNVNDSNIVLIWAY